jgi:hypothetical protein
MNFFDFLLNCGLLHWFLAFAGIIAFQFARIFPLAKTYLLSWPHRNLIPLIWSMFWISLLSCLMFTYYTGYTLDVAFIVGYAGSHIINRLSKPVYYPRKNSRKTQSVKLPRV